jgi:hypothetical protein
VRKAARIANESLRTEGKILRSNEAIDLAADDCAYNALMQWVLAEQVIAQGRASKDQAQILATMIKNKQRILESIGVFDKLPEDDEKDY